MIEEQPQTTSPEPNERIAAALAHASVIVPTIGFVVPVVIWVTQKEKSAYVAFQAVQAAAYQLLMVMIWFLGMGCYMCSIIGFIPLQAGLDYAMNSSMEILFVFPFLVFGAVILLSLAWVIYGLAAAVMALQGKDFRYLILGDRIEHFLASN